MPGPLEDSLSRFTPSPGGLDRDALLFAAGRASARPGRKWPTVAALLALSQALTLALLVAGTPPPRDRSRPPPAVPAVPSESAPPSRRWPAAGGRPRRTSVPPPASDDLMPDEPPLHVSSAWDPFDCNGSIPTLTKETPHVSNAPAALLALASALLAADPPKKDEAPTRTTIALTVSAMAEPRPALRYTLLPELKDMNPGNPIQGYLKCFMEQNHFFYDKTALPRIARSGW